MLTVSKKAAAVLKAAKAAQGAPPEAGVRIVKGAMPDDSGTPALAVGFALSEGPAPDDEQLEQNGVRIFVEDPRSRAALPTSCLRSSMQPI